MKKVWISGILITSAIVVGAIGYGMRPQVEDQKQAVPISEAKPVLESHPPTVDELLTKVNEERAKVGVAPLVIDEKLNKSAQQKADDMVANNYFGHVDMNGRHGYDIAHEAMPECIYTGENLTDNTTIDDNTSAQAVFSWVHSPAHYAAMISNKNVLTGFGIAGTKVVEHFCTLNQG